MMPLCRAMRAMPPAGLPSPVSIIVAIKSDKAASHGLQVGSDGRQAAQRSSAE